MMLALGSRVSSSGCLTRLIDIVDRKPNELEELVGYRSGRLARGFYVLLLKQPLSKGDFEFFGYTHMSGGKIGLPSNDPKAEGARPRVHDVLLTAMRGAGPKVAPDIEEIFAAGVPLTGQYRYVKIASRIDHDPQMGPADQYPASRLSISQLNLKKAKSFLVGAEVFGTIWTLADASHTRLDIAARARYDLPYRDDPRSRITEFLASA